MFIFILGGPIMGDHEMLSILEEGLKNGRISPHLAAYIAGEILDIEAHETDYVDWSWTPDEVEIAVET